MNKIPFLQIFRILMGINFRVLLILILLGLGGIFYVGAITSPIIVFVFSVCIISFLLSIYLTKWVLSKDEGPSEMVQVHLFSISSSCDVFLIGLYGFILYIINLLYNFMLLWIHLTPLYIQVGRQMQHNFFKGYHVSITCIFCLCAWILPCIMWTWDSIFFVLYLSWAYHLTF